jgi:2-polyprenyl-3-methyl-5-hydroxy-6-metoxy-1,4-benzoquinol methylase
MNCQYCFAPKLAAWDIQQFKEKIYNDEYALVDPEHESIRPRRIAESLINAFPVSHHQIKHLDFGGGNGQLSQLLREANWQSFSMDPFFDQASRPDIFSKFNLITAFEVFEHHPNPIELIDKLHSLLSPNGLIFFSTLISDQEIVSGKKLDWWYAAPRNGHISLFSRASLKILGERHGMRLYSLSENFHCYLTQAPPWARIILPLA